MILLVLPPPLLLVQVVEDPHRKSVTLIKRKELVVLRRTHCFSFVRVLVLVLVLVDSAAEEEGVSVLFSLCI